MYHIQKLFLRMNVGHAGLTKIKGVSNGKYLGCFNML